MARQYFNAVWQHRTHNLWLQRHYGYWQKRLAGCGRLRFPQDSSFIEQAGGWGSLPVRIGSSLKAQLQRWCRSQGTTLAMSVFTAFVALVLRWCHDSDAVIRYQTDGRSSPLVANTIGYFAAVLNLHIEMNEGDTFLDLLRRVIGEYYNAHEHADYSFIDAQVPRPDFTRNPGFNWVPENNEVVTGECAPLSGELAVSKVPFAFPAPRAHDGDYEPSILLFERRDEIDGILCFPLSRFSCRTMERFAANLVGFVAAIAHESQQRIADVSLH
jgi:hypothetical protein